MMDQRYWELLFTTASLDVAMNNVYSNQYKMFFIQKGFVRYNPERMSGLGLWEVWCARRRGSSQRGSEGACYG